MSKKIFHQLLLDYDIELKQSLAIEMYCDMDPKERSLMANKSGDMSSFKMLDDALFSMDDTEMSRHDRIEILSGCKDSISSLVKSFNLSTKRDPRKIISSSTYPVRTEAIRFESPSSSDEEDPSSEDQ